jgi:hypothetical protein
MDSNREFFIAKSLLKKAGTTGKSSHLLPNQPGQTNLNGKLARGMPEAPNDSKTGVFFARSTIFQHACFERSKDVT